MELGNGLEVIGERAFEDLDIRTIVIPPSVRVIGKYAFYNCSMLRKVEFSVN